jgi:hypothetical protein
MLTEPLREEGGKVEKAQVEKRSEEDEGSKLTGPLREEDGKVEETKEGEVKTPTKTVQPYGQEWTPAAKTRRSVEYYNMSAEETESDGEARWRAGGKTREDVADAVAEDGEARWRATRTTEDTTVIAAVTSKLRRQVEKSGLALDAKAVDALGGMPTTAAEELLGKVTLNARVRNPSAYVCRAARRISEEAAAEEEVPKDGPEGGPAEDEEGERGEEGDGGDGGEGERAEEGGEKAEETGDNDIEEDIAGEAAEGWEGHGEDADNWRDDGADEYWDEGYDEHAEDCGEDVWW